jgi:thiamine-phosphate pyrophosphorylase
MPFQLCYITDRHLLGPKPLLPRVLEVAHAGVDVIQIREKDLATRALVDLVKLVMAAARGAPSRPVPAGITTPRIVVNDRLDVALALDADGVHLGVGSMPTKAVRACVPDSFLVGASCHSLEEAVAADAAGADYVLLGPIFETPSKIPYGPPLGLAKLREVSARVRIPVLALGGITVERVRPCVEAGAKGVAGVRIFQDCESAEGRVRELRAQFTGSESL